MLVADVARAWIGLAPGTVASAVAVLVKDRRDALAFARN